jgi:hypothetical protein
MDDVVPLFPRSNQEWTLKRYLTMDDLKATENRIHDFRDADESKGKDRGAVRQLP